MDLERRNYPRHTVSIPYQLGIITQDKKNKYIEGKISELSLSALKVALNQGLENGGSFLIELKLSNDQILKSPIYLERKINDGNNCTLVFNLKNISDEMSNALKSHLETIPTISDRRQTTDRRKNREKDTTRRLKKTVFSRCIKYSRAKKLLQNHQYFFYREFQSSTANYITMNGHKMYMFGSNNYLGLADHPEIVETMIRTAEKYGVGSGGSRILCGTMDLHNELEKKLADFIEGEECLIYSIGYATNLGLISALLDQNGYLLVDEAAHASIIDGAILGKTNIEMFKHNDLASLERRLKKIEFSTPKIISTEGIFSMEGDIAKINEIFELGNTYNAAILLDDAHATGVLGQNGKGTAEYAGLLGKIDLTVGTMSKALGCIGGFVVAKKGVIQYLKHVSKSFLFTTSLPPAITASIIKALEIIQRDDSLRKNLWKNVNYIRGELLSLGFNLGNSQSPIIPLIFRNEIDVYTMTKYLQEANIFISPVAYPAVKKKEPRLRVSIMATHTNNDLQYLLDSLKKIGKQLNVI